MAASSINTECKRYGCMKNLLACYANCRYNTRCEELKDEITDKVDQAATDINSYLFERGRNPISIQFLKRGLKFADLKKTEPAQIPKKKVTLAGLEPRVRSALSGSHRAASIPVGKSNTAAAKESRPALKAKPKVSKRKRTKTRKAAVPLPLKSTAGVTDARSSSLLEKSQALQSKSQVTKPSRLSASKRSETVAIATVFSNPEKKIEKQRQKKRRVMPHITNRKLKNLSAEQSADSPAAAREVVSGGNSKSKPAARQNKRKSSVGKAKANGKLYIILEGKQASLVNERELMAHLLSNPSGGVRYFEAKEVEARVQIVLKP